MKDRLAVLRRLLDPEGWPLREDDVWLVADGEVYAFRDEENIYKVLFSERFVAR
jgi:hypothetical protein